MVANLFYRSGDKMMAVDIYYAAWLSPQASPGCFFEGPYELSPVQTDNYDISPDGQRFLMLKPAEQEQAAPTPN